MRQDIRLVVTEKPARKPHTDRFYALIRSDYHKMKAVKKYGVSMCSQDYIFGVLADKYFRSPKTIENIIFNRV